MPEYNKIILTKEQFEKITHAGEIFCYLTDMFDLNDIYGTPDFLKEFNRQVKEFKDIIDQSGMTEKEIRIIQNYYDSNDYDYCDYASSIKLFQMDGKTVTSNEYLLMMEKLKTFKTLKKLSKDLSEEERLFFEKIKEKFYMIKPYEYLIFVIENDKYFSIDCGEIINLIKDIHANFCNLSNYLEAKKIVEDFENECK